jgi:hypothetical protein
MYQTKSIFLLTRSSCVYSAGQRGVDPQEYPTWIDNQSAGSKSAHKTELKKTSYRQLKSDYPGY